jgi:hypothetical protein
VGQRAAALVWHLCTPTSLELSQLRLQLSHLTSPLDGEIARDIGSDAAPGFSHGYAFKWCFRNLLMTDTHTAYTHTEISTRHFSFCRFQNVKQIFLLTFVRDFFHNFYI